MNVIMPSVAMLNVVMMSGIMLIVIMPSVVMQNVVAPSIVHSPNQVSSASAVSYGCKLFYNIGAGLLY
jgi:hypothetical protein